MQERNGNAYNPFGPWNNDSSRSWSPQRPEPASVSDKHSPRALRLCHSNSSADTICPTSDEPTPLRYKTAPEASTSDHRVLLHQLQKVVTIGAGSNDRKRNPQPRTGFTAVKLDPPKIPDEAEYVVEYEGADDLMHPQNWTMRRKVDASIILAYSAFCSTFASSLLSPSDHAISAHFHIALEVATLTTALYVLGYALGPLIWAPMSELKGRRLPILLGMFGSSIFCLATATSKDVQTLLICRFFAGLFGSSPLSIVAAAFSDIFDNAQRGIAIAVYAGTVLLGPTLAPCFGAFVQNSSLGWRWNAYIPAMMSAVACLLCLLWLDETYSPIVLVNKAHNLRRKTQNWAIHARQEEVEIDLRQLLHRNITRPLRLLTLEPVILLISLQLSVVYAILYAFSTAYAEVFEGIYGIRPRLAGLTLLGMAVGILLGAAWMVWENSRHVKRLNKNDGIPVPEWRLISVSIGTALFACSLFWFGWTGYNKSIPWIVPVLSGVLNGAALMVVYVQLSTYIVEGYLAFAASATAATTIVRCSIAASFPLFTRQMFAKIGVQWGLTLFACLGLICVPISVYLAKYGAGLRQASISRTSNLIAGKRVNDDLEEKAGGKGHHHWEVALHATKTKVTHSGHGHRIRAALDV